jgi:hypothetical protein
MIALFAIYAAKIEKILLMSKEKHKKFAFCVQTGAVQQVKNNKEWVL